MTEDQTLGFIGLGKMGRPMLQRLIDSGRKVVIYDTNCDALDAAVALGGIRAESVLDVARRAQIIMLSLPSPDIVKAVVTSEKGLINGDRVKTIIDFSTIGTRAAKFIDGFIIFCKRHRYYLFGLFYFASFCEQHQLHRQVASLLFGQAQVVEEVC